MTNTKKGALLVPQRAVQELQGAYRLAVVTAENTVSMRPVKTGARVGKLWVVEEGLNPDERIVVEGLQKVKDGAQVNPKPIQMEAANAVTPAVSAAAPLPAAKAGRSSMARFFINRPIVAIVISILLTIAGIVSLNRLPITQLPDIVPPQVQVSTTYTGADAVAVEQAVATSIEQQVNGVDNMLYMKSTSANDGTLLLSVDFEVGTNLDIDKCSCKTAWRRRLRCCPPKSKTSA